MLENYEFLQNVDFVDRRGPEVQQIFKFRDGIVPPKLSNSSNLVKRMKPTGTPVRNVVKAAESAKQEPHNSLRDPAQIEEEEILEDDGPDVEAIPYVLSGINSDRHRQSVNNVRYDNVNMEPLFEKLSLVSEGQTMAYALSYLKNLTGGESSGEIKRYFVQLEAVAGSLSGKSRANLVALKVQGRARLIFESQPVEVQREYEKIKSILMSKLTDSNAAKISAQNTLMNGVPRKNGESILDFSQ